MAHYCDGWGGDGRTTWHTTCGGGEGMGGPHGTLHVRGGEGMGGPHGTLHVRGGVDKMSACIPPWCLPCAGSF